jgi:hypothetical protein
MYDVIINGVKFINGIEIVYYCFRRKWDCSHAI